MTFLRWLLFGRDDLQMPRSWLANVARLKAYEHWTLEQRESSVTKDTAWFRRQAFWEAIESKSQRTAHVIRGRFS